MGLFQKMTATASLILLLGIGFLLLATSFRAFAFFAAGVLLVVGLLSAFAFGYWKAVHDRLDRDPSRSRVAGWSGTDRRQTVRV
jgi:hypothetical protein